MSGTLEAATVLEWLHQCGFDTSFYDEEAEQERPGIADPESGEDITDAYVRFAELVRRQVVDKEVAPLREQLEEVRFELDMQIDAGVERNEAVKAAKSAGRDLKLLRESTVDAKAYESLRKDFELAEASVRAAEARARDAEKELESLREQLHRRTNLIRVRNFVQFLALAVPGQTENMPTHELLILLEIFRAHNAGERLTQQDILQRLQVPQQYVSRDIQSLGAVDRQGKPGAGLIETYPDPDDARRNLIRLTTAGENVVDDLAEALDDGWL